MKLGLSLITKLTLVISLILAVFMALLDYINVKNFRSAMLKYAVTNADQIAEVINQSAFDAMLKNDKGRMYDMISRIGQDPNFEHIRLIGREGTVVFSSTKNEIGMVLDTNAEACTMCHGKNENPRLHATSMQRSRIFKNREGKEVMGFTKAIYNQPACIAAACHVHPEKFNVLGMLDIIVSLEEMNKKSHEYRREFFLFTCFLLIFTGVLINVLIQRMVNKPVKFLRKHANMVAAGILDARVTAVSDDELGQLSESVNMMTVSLQMAQVELKEWGNSLETKVEERTSEIKRIEQHLLRSEKLASLGKLVAGIAHEINNPLTGVLLYSSIIYSDKRLDGELKPDVEKIISESKRCADIVSRLLEFSRESMPHKEAICLNALLEKVVNIIHKQPSFQEITIVQNYAGDLPDVLVDPGQAQQVFINMILNASHAMNEGGTLTISTFTDENQSTVHTEITDTGCGISEDDLGHIFDPFFTTKSEGTGLGLSISYGIVENNGGKIEVRSVLGKGTTFTVQLPVYDKSLMDDFTA
ncbi:MAG: HAMP domain-containing protein [Steroidobacteraceae bacterium]|nr:HAMP domain-containing protein [Deltaproteobacteria bacterium]